MYINFLEVTNHGTNWYMYVLIVQCNFHLTSVSKIIKLKNIWASTHYKFILA